MNIAQVLLQQALIRGDAAAIIDSTHGRDRVTTFGELNSASARIAALLASRGIGKSDTLLLLHPMSAELYAFLIAVFRLGAAAMVIDPSAGRRHIEQCLRMVPPKAFFGSARAHLIRLWVPALRRVQVKFSSSRVLGSTYLSLALQGEERRAIEPVADTDAALITFTSGSTGEPKAAVRSHGFLLAQHRVMQSSLQHSAGDMDLTTLPVFVLANLASGITSVIPEGNMRRPGAVDPRPVLAQLERLPIQTMAASPAFIRRLVEGSRSAHLRPQNIQRVFMGGAPVFPDDLTGAHEAFPSAEITAVYGSTEAEPIADLLLSSISAQDFQSMQQGGGLLAGFPVADIALRVLRNQWGKPIPPMTHAQFDALSLAPQAVGEIAVSGAHVLGRYLNGAGDAEIKFRVDNNVWHRTGDLGWLDERGRLWLVGRASAAVNDDRGVLYPFCVECAARQISGVRSAALVPVNGRRILAVELDHEATPEQVRQHLAWAQLDEVRRVSAIPMDKRHNAKVDYPALERILTLRK